MIQTNSSTPRVTARPHQQGIPKQAVPIPNSTSLSSLSDHELLMLCTQYGTQAKVWKQKFLGLLPEVNSRQLYLKEGCTSVFEFAAKLGGVSKEQVKLVLSVHHRFTATPVLKHALVSGEVSVNKLARVVSVATLENQEFLLNQSKLLSNRALETLVQDTKSLHVRDKQINSVAFLPPDKSAVFDICIQPQSIGTEILEYENHELGVVSF